MGATNSLNDTLSFFLNQITYTGPLTFDEWDALPTRDHKIAVLYIQFFDQICYAWSRARADYVDDDDLVSCVLQYLNKNVTKIENDKKRFTPAYIQTVAYNCMDCIRCMKGKIEKAKNEVPTVLRHTDEGDLDVLDITGCNDEIELQYTSEEFWSIIEDMGVKTEKVVQHLISGTTLRRVPKRSSGYMTDPLRDVTVSKEETEEIIEKLREKLRPFLEVDFYQTAHI